MIVGRVQNIVRLDKSIIRRADAARDAKHYRRAARLYENALKISPDNAAIHVQCGHMFKEAGEFARAERHYKRAHELAPNDPDLALQFGHFYKISGRLAEAELAYRRAAELDRNWTEPARYLGDLYRAGWRNHVNQSIERPAVAGSPSSSPSRNSELADSRADRARLYRDERLIPELAPRPPESYLHAHGQEIQIRALGRRERTRWGVRNTLRGADCIRGFCISAFPIVELRASVNGLRFYVTVPEGHPLKYEREDPRKKKYVFNIWYDFSNFCEGLHELELQFVDENHGIQIRQEEIVIAPPLSEAEYPNSDRLVSASATDPRELEEQINSRPSMIRPARRTPFATPPRNVLILRVDQLGDMVISIPALRRLRELLPEARIVGLLSTANADLARSLELFDEIIAIDFPDDDWERRRIMPLEKQDELRRRLAPYKFDVAIDMLDSEMSRPLLHLSGAAFRAGFWEGRTQWLSATFKAYTNDPLNNLEDVPASAKMLGLIGWFGTFLHNHSQIIRREDLTRDRLTLEPYRLPSEHRFAVLHTGARAKLSRWPYYDRLAAMILDQTDLKVVMITDDPKTRASLPQRLTASDRFRLLDRRLPFDDFDALLSFCTVFVGNDSGPSHLASLRGANVVTLYPGRRHWSEWGHENRGYIISRRVPCAGCSLLHDPEECGKSFSCITNITASEVFETVMNAMESASRPLMSSSTPMPEQIGFAGLSRHHV